MDEIVVEVNVVYGHAPEDREWGLAALAAGLDEEATDTFVETLSDWVAAGRSGRGREQRRRLLDEVGHPGRVLAAAVISRDPKLGLPPVRGTLAGALS